MQVTLEYAQQHLADIVSAAARGEEVEIAQAEHPTVKLVLADAVHFVPQQGQRIFGAGRGELRVPGDEEWARMKRETADLMNNGPIFPE